MNKKSSETQLPTASLSEISSAPRSFITFPVEGHLFALPSHQVLKIVETPSAQEGGLLSLGFVQLAEYNIQLLDLPELLTLKPKTKTDAKTPVSTHPPFLLVLQGSSTQSLFGITLDAPPDLVDVPAYELQLVPAEKRQTGTLRWINYVAIYEKQKSRQVLLMLDLSALLTTQQTPTQMAETNLTDVISKAMTPQMAA